jgi:hypothetical protein
MYLIRDIFQLKFGAFKDALQLMKQAKAQNILPDSNTRVASDFTGRSYRLIFENQFESLAVFEKNLSEGMKSGEWQNWYAQFKQHVESSEREILKIHNLG